MGDRRQAYLHEIAKVRQRLEDRANNGSWYAEDIGLLLGALDSITATAKALPAELVTAERKFFDQTVDEEGVTYYTPTKSISQSEPYPSRERLYEFGESGDYDEHTVKVIVDIDTWLAVLDYVTDWAPDGPDPDKAREDAQVWEQSQ